VIAISQALLIAAAIYGFQQSWNIEYEVPAEAGAGDAVRARPERS
jgi:hypothetical protein